MREFCTSGSVGAPVEKSPGRPSRLGQFASRSCPIARLFADADCCQAEVPPLGVDDPENHDRRPQISQLCLYSARSFTHSRIRF